MLQIGENVSNIRFVAWDTETTGASPSEDHLVEIAAIAFDEEFEHRRFDMLVKPPIPIPADAMKIHGISDEMVAGAPASGEALARFFEFLRWSGSPRVLLAHNAGFDVAVLNGEAQRGRVSVPELLPEAVLDTCMLAKNLLPELPQHRVESLARHFKLETGRLHRALEDVAVLKGIFLNLLGLAADRVAEKGGGLTLNALIDLAGGYFALNPSDAGTRRHPFRLPPRIAALEPLCGTESRVAILYEIEEDYRYITPIAIRIRGFKVYVDAFCHRDNIKKTFRADKILRLGPVGEGGG